MFVSFFVLASTPFKTCVSADHMHLSDLTLSPDPPVHGEHVSLKITSTPDIAITAGTVTVAATVFGIPVPGGPTYDLCTDVGFHCPLAPAKPVAASVDVVPPWYERYCVRICTRTRRGQQQRQRLGGSAQAAAVGRPADAMQPIVGAVAPHDGSGRQGACARVRMAAHTSCLPV